jgi:hypothetical protein
MNAPVNLPRLSEHFTIAEATYSPTAERLGINNYPTPEALERMKFTAIRMEAVRQVLENKNIYVTSWYRGPLLNRAINGVPNSQHTRGEAVDFICQGYGNVKQICQKLIDNKDVLQYDQLILEPTWVHISFVPNNPRLQELTKTSAGYSAGISF